MITFSLWNSWLLIANTLALLWSRLLWFTRETIRIGIGNSGLRDRFITVINHNFQASQKQKWSASDNKRKTQLNSLNVWLLTRNSGPCTTSLLVLVPLSSPHCLFSSFLACKDAAQSMLCWTAACSQRAGLAFLAGEHKCWPQDRTLSPLLWVTALLEMWTQDLVAPVGS